MRFIKASLILFLIQLLAVCAFAAHIKGGWMYYEYLGQAANGNSIYKIMVKVYRDCTPPNAGQNDTQINITIFRNDNFSKQADLIAPQAGIYNLSKQSFSECINPKPVVCYVIMDYSTTVELPNIASGYTASFQRCCRISGIVNVAQPSNSYGNTYSITIPGTNFGAGNVINSSPKFVEKDTVVVCYNSPMQLDYGATDADGDSLVYAFASALNGGSQSNPVPVTAGTPPYSSVPYLSGYGISNPFGSNTVINPRTGLITGTTPGITGEYVLAVSLKEYRNGAFIAETRKELHVNVAPCNLVAAQLPLKVTSCDGYTVQFENLSSSPAITSYYWDFGDKKITSDTSSLARPSYTYADTGVYIAKLVVNKNSACSDSSSMEVNVFPGFFPDFTWNGSCFANPFDFTDLSSTRYGQINYHRWNFGDPATIADTSRLRNPQYQYPASGSYNVSLEVASNKGCIDTISKVLQVLDKPVLQFAFTDTLICSIDSLKLSAIGTGNFTWTPSARMINANTATPTVFPLDTTTYSATLNDRGCVTSGTVKVNVLSFITVDAGPDTTICRTDGITLKPVTHALSFSWTPAIGLSNPNLKNPVATPLTPSTTYSITANLGKCQANDEITIRTVPYPLVNAGLDTAVCFGDRNFLRGTTNGSFYQWTPSATIDNPISLNTSALPLQTTSFVLRATDTLGCPKPAFDSVLVRVIPTVKVFAGNDTTIVIGQPMQLNGIANSTIYRWEPTFGLNNPNIPNPTLTIAPNSLPDSDEVLKYILTVSSPEGCQSSDEINIKVFRTGPTIFMPNAFTPDGDGKNDVFRPILAGMRQFDFFRVYNRYGQLLFETRQIDKGWDGRVKGQLQSSGAFIYNCQAVDYTGKTVRLQGTFVLIR